MRLALVFMALVGVARGREGLVSVFHEFSAGIGGAFILAGGLGAGLSFYGV